MDLSALAVLSASPPPPPPIVFIVADDLGFNDVGFHGSKQIPTPALDEIAHTGITLDNYHAQPVCSPTRASLLSGRHAIHHGIYMPFAQGSALRLNLSYTLLPAHLKALGYETHAVGKWHLGQNELAALPTGRGFDTYYGYWCGAEDYIDHSTTGAYDFADGTRTCWEANGTYSTYAFAARAVQLIEASRSGVPFFMYLAWQNVHWPLEAPAEFLARFANTTGGDPKRQAVAAMAAIADEGVHNVTSALKRKGLWEETVLVFVSDNGGPTNGNEGTASNNFPMRGGKNTLWEGGTRVIAAVRGPMVHAAAVGTVSHAPVHAVDWLPSLLSLASAKRTPVDSHTSAGHVAGRLADWRRLLPASEPPFLDGDGVDVSFTLRTGEAVRVELLLECHPEPAPWHAYVRNASAAGGFSYREGYLASGHDARPPSMLSFAACRAACAADASCEGFTFEANQSQPASAVKCYCKTVAHVLPRGADQVHGNALIVGEWKYLHLGAVRPADEAGWHPPPGQDPKSTAYQLGCDVSKQPIDVDPDECVHVPCLFHVASDPCEYVDLAGAHPERVAQLAKRLSELQATAVPPVGPEGCRPVITRGAWRPCDAPDPGDAEPGDVEPGHAEPGDVEPGIVPSGSAPAAVSRWVEEEEPESRARRGSGYSYGRGEYVVVPAPSAPEATLSA